MKERCRNYVGVACVDGSCPSANREEYEERYMPVQRLFLLQGMCGLCFSRYSILYYEKGRRYRYRDIINSLYLEVIKLEHVLCLEMLDTAHI